MSNIIGVGQLSLLDLNDAVISGQPPSNPSVGSLWINEDSNPVMLNKWNGLKWVEVGELDPNLSVVIDDINETLGNMANDSIINFQERQVVKDRLSEIIGSVISDTATSLPTSSSLDSGEKGGFWSVRKSALNAGISSSDSLYTNVETRYNNLRSYLGGLTPIKPWDVRSSNKDVMISVVKSTFRDRWLQYYLAVDALATATSEKLKQNVDDIEIGGRNLLILYNLDMSRHTNVEIDYENGIISGTGNFYISFEHVKLIPDTDYTFRYQRKNTDFINLYVRNPRTGVGSYVLRSINENESYIFKLPQSVIDEIGLYQVRPYFSNSTILDFELEKLNLQKGNKATDWTPAPEDVQDKIDYLEGEVTDVKSEITDSSIINKVTRTTQWSDLTQRVTSAEQKILPNAIVSTVTSSTDWINLENEVSSVYDYAEPAIPEQPTPPSGSIKGAKWVDTSVNPPQLKLYDGSSWHAVKGEKGEKGDKGDTGPRGATGERGPRGDAGTSVTGVTEYYLASTASSGVTTGTSGWTTTMQQMTPSKKYLWNYEKIHFSDDTSQNTLPVIIGVYGDKGDGGEDGRSIVSIEERYLATSASSGVTRSTSGWTANMQQTTTSKRYLWNYEIITWNKAPLTTYIEPIIIGVHGETGPKGDKGDQGPQGIQGPKGEDGQSQYVHIRYSANANGNPMTTTPQSNSKYIGLANTTSPTAPSGYASYKWALMRGADGQDGIPGPKGDNGQTTYTWVRYADDENGSGMSDSPHDKLYIGLAFNKTTPTESNNANDYTWSLMPQNIEIGGRNLIRNSDFSDGLHDAGDDRWQFRGTTGELSSDNNLIISSEKGTSSSMDTVIWLSNREVFPSGSYLTLTFRLKADPSNAILVRLGSSGWSSGTHRLNVGTEMKDYSVSFPIVSSSDNTRAIVFWLESAGEIEIERVQLEKGNKATDWSPAPEDVQEEIDAIEQRVSTAEQKILPNAIVSTVTSSTDWKNLDDTAKTLRDSTIPSLSNRVVSAESSITQLSNQISSKVSQTDFNGNTIASLINQTATTININASKINLKGAVSVLSDIAGSLGTITAGNIRGARIVSTGTSSSDNVTIDNGRIDVKNGGDYGETFIRGRELEVRDTMFNDRIILRPPSLMVREGYFNGNTSSNYNGINTTDIISNRRNMTLLINAYDGIRHSGGDLNFFTDNSRLIHLRSTAHAHKGVVLGTTIPTSQPEGSIYYDGTHIRVRQASGWSDMMDAKVYSNPNSPSTVHEFGIISSGVTSNRSSSYYIGHKLASTWYRLRAGYADVAGSVSLENMKSSISLLPFDSLKKIEDSNIYQWQYKNDEENKMLTGYRYGLVIGRETPREVIDLDGERVDHLSMISLSWDAIKILSNKNRELEKEVKELKSAIKDIRSNHIK